MVAKWSETMSYDFVKKYMELESLWNRNHPFYNNMIARKAAYNELRQVVKIPNFTINDVRKKISIFRSTYNQELTRVKKSLTYHPTLAWFDIMDAQLRNHIIGRKLNTDTDSFYTSKSTEDSIDEKLTATVGSEQGTKRTWPIVYEHTVFESYDDDMSPSHVLKYDADDSVNNSNVEDEAEKEENTSSESRNPPPKRAKRSTINDQVSTMEDEFDIFGKSIALQLRKMPLSIALNTHIEIQKVLMNARLQVKDS